METDRFDAMTRRLATPTPRRTVLKGMAAMATTGLFALVGGREAAAAKPPCATFCQTAREEFYAFCPNAGGRTTRSFSCDPWGDEEGYCYVASACLTTYSSPSAGPADPAYCQEARASCIEICGDPGRMQFRCNPAQYQSACICKQ